jgi:hypothetical protein
MGCGSTLFLDGQNLQCSSHTCPRPDAASELLADSETEHLVTFGATDFTIRHPLRERLGEDLNNCALHLFCRSLPGPRRRSRTNWGPLGTYRAVRAADGAETDEDGCWVWSQVKV